MSKLLEIILNTIVGFLVGCVILGAIVLFINAIMGGLFFFIGYFNGHPVGPMLYLLSGTFVIAFIAAILYQFTKEDNNDKNDSR